MQNLINQIAEDLQIKKYEYEDINEYGNRILYGAIIAWIKSQILNYNNNQEEYESTYIDMDSDIKGINKRKLLWDIKKVAVGLVKVIQHDKIWLNGKNKDSTEIELCKYIRDMIVFCRLTQIISGANVYIKIPEAKVYFKNNTLIIGEKTWSNHKSDTKLIGIGSWNDKQKGEINYKEIFNIPNMNILQYYQSLVDNADWKVKELTGEYEFFNSKEANLHYYSWGKFETDKFYSTIVLIRNSNNNKEYMLAKYYNEQYHYARLDEWYLKEKEINRIMYSLRAKDKNICVFDAEKTKNTVKLKCINELPNAELRIIMLSSWPKRYYDDKYQRVIPIEIWEDIEDVLNNLGIAIRIK